MENKIERLSVNMTSDAMKDLRDMAQEQQTTLTNVLNKAVFIERFLTEEIRKGGSIEVRSKDGAITKVVLR